MTDKPKTTSTTAYPFEPFYPIQQQSPRPTINPFYYGFNFIKKSTTSYPFYKFPSIAAQNPTDLKEFEFNQLQTASSTVSPQFVAPAYFPFTTTTTESTPNIESAYAVSTSSPEYAQPPDTLQSSSTRNPLFEIYLKRIASTTKNPYDFGNFKQYFKTTTTVQTPYAYNLLGANSNTATLNATPEQKHTITRSDS